MFCDIHEIIFLYTLETPATNQKFYNYVILINFVIPNASWDCSFPSLKSLNTQLFVQFFSKLKVLIHRRWMVWFMVYLSY